MNVEALIFQQIVDANFDQAIYTASPNNTINVVEIAAKGSGTNIGLALTPKGTGYLSAQVPNSGTGGGNARGANSVDWQTSRTAAAQVASGQFSGILCGQNNTATGSCIVAGISCSGSSDSVAAIAIGELCTASNNWTVSLGRSCTASGSAAAAIGRSNTAGGGNSFASGLFATSHVVGMRAHSNALSLGNCQEVAALLTASTTTNSEVEALTASSTRIVLRAGSILSGVVTIAGNKSDGSAVARYQRQVTIKRVVNTTSLVGSVITLGTDEAAGTSIAITADDTNDSLKVGVTGVASENWNWSVMFHGLEKNL